MAPLRFVALQAAGLLVGFASEGARKMIHIPRPSRHVPVASGFLLLASSIMTLSAATPAHALTWNWTADTAGCPSSGTLETDGSTYVANQNYNVISITGDICGWTVTGLYEGVGSIVAWDGTEASPFLSLTNASYNGVFFTVQQGAATNDWNWESVDTGNLEPINDTNYNGNITFSQLTPANSPDPVPGPLPLMGAAAAFGWTRKLRRRISADRFRL
jgi:hypothetical protein